METFNGNVVPSNTDMWNLVADIQKMAVQNNRVIPVSSKTARDALADSAPDGVVPDGTVVLRMDQSTAGTVFDTMIGGVWVEGDTGWVNLSFASGFQQQGTQPNRYRRVGREVKVEIGVTGSGSPSVLPTPGTPLYPFSTTLPDGIRPKVSPKYFIGPGQSLDQIVRVIFELDGRISVTAKTTGTTNYALGVYPWFAE